MKKLTCVLLMVLLFALSACAQNLKEEPTSVPTQPTLPPETTEAFNLADYQSTISSCLSQMTFNSDILLLMADYEVSVWDAHVRLSSSISREDLVASAYKALEEADYPKSRLEADHNTILNFYKEIISTKVSGGEGEALKEVFNQYFDAYLNLYSLVNSPSDELTILKEKVDSISTTIETCETKLGALLP